MLDRAQLKQYSKMKEEVKGVKQKLKPDLSDKNIKQ